MKRFGHRQVAAGASMITMGSLLVGLGAATGGPAAAATAHTIDVGFVCSCSGALSSSTALARSGYQAWEDWVDAAGGIDGMKVDVDYIDDASNPGTGLADVEQAVTQDHVVALVDAAASDTAWATYAQQHGVPVVGGSSASQLFIQDPDFFAVGETLDEYSTNFVEAAKKIGVTSVSELYCAESTSCLEGVVPLRTTAQKLNLPLVYVTEISSSAPDYLSQCQAAQEAGTQGLIIVDSAVVVQSVMSNCAQRGYVPWEISLDGAVAASFTRAPGLSDHLIGSEPDIPFFVHDATTAAMDHAIEKYEPSVLTSPDYGEEVTQQWVSGLLLTAAIKAARIPVGETPTAAEVLKGLYRLHRDTLGGMAPPLTYKKGQPNPVDCWFWIRTENGKFVTPYGLAPDCVTPVSLT